MGLGKKDVELTLLKEEAQIMTADVSIMNPIRRAWFDKNQKMIQDRDVGSFDIFELY